MTPIFKLLYLNQETGEYGRLPDNAIINAGGVAGPTFTVGGKALLFDDGTSTGGSGNPLVVDLQQAYNQSSTGAIDLTLGKNFSINALNQKIFQVDASTGRVTITGDLTVLGSSTVIEGTLANVDQVVVNPPNSTTTGFIIEPMVGVNMTADLFRIRAANAGPAVFTIDASGNTTLQQLTVTGSINGINLSQFYSDFQDHVSNSGIKHTAKQISVDDTNFQSVSGTDVQEALESIDARLVNLAASGGGSAIKTYEHVQGVPSNGWIVNHNKNSVRPTVAIYDDTGVQIYPDEVMIVNANSIAVAFGTPITGRAIVLLF